MASNDVYDPFQAADELRAQHAGSGDLQLTTAIDVSTAPQSQPSVHSTSDIALAIGDRRLCEPAVSTPGKPADARSAPSLPSTGSRWDSTSGRTRPASPPRQYNQRSHLRDEEWGQGTSTADGRDRPDERVDGYAGRRDRAEQLRRVDDSGATSGWGSATQSQQQHTAYNTTRDSAGMMTGRPSSGGHQNSSYRPDESWAPQRRETTIDSHRVDHSHWVPTSRSFPIRDVRKVQMESPPAWPAAHASQVIGWGAPHVGPVDDRIPYSNTNTYTTTTATMNTSMPLGGLRDRSWELSERRDSVPERPAGGLINPAMFDVSGLLPKPTEHTIAAATVLPKPTEHTIAAATVLPKPTEHAHATTAAGKKRLRADAAHTSHVGSKSRVDMVIGKVKIAIKHELNRYYSPTSSDPGILHTKEELKAVAGKIFSKLEPKLSSTTDYSRTKTGGMIKNYVAKYMQSRALAKGVWLPSQAAETRSAADDDSEPGSDAA